MSGRKQELVLGVIGVIDIHTRTERLFEFVFCPMGNSGTDCESSASATVFRYLVENALL